LSRRVRLAQAGSGDSEWPRSCSRTSPIVGDPSGRPTAHIAVAVEFYSAIHRVDLTGTLDTLAADFTGHVSQGFPGGLGRTYRGPQEMMDRV
jgi:hypothetical protein